METPTPNMATRSLPWRAISGSHSTAAVVTPIVGNCLGVRGGSKMAITLETFAAECRGALKSNPGTPGREKVRELVKKALGDSDFVATYIPAGTPERHLLYEDPEL